MIIISVSEFRKNIKKYLDIADTQRLVVNRGKEGSFAVVPVEEMKDESYDDFKARIQQEIRLGMSDNKK